MSRIETGLRSAMAIMVAGFVGLSLQALVSKPISVVTTASIAIFLVALVGATWVGYRHPRNVFAIIASLFATLLIGRLFSTMRFEEGGAAALSAIDPLLLAETGPGIPVLTYASVVVFIGLIALLLRTAWQNYRGQSNDTFYSQLTANDWALTFLRVYVGLMFIAHFAGHLFAGPVPFAVFAEYFGSIGLPYPAAFVVLAGLIELAVTIGLAFGFMTRIAAVGAAVYLLVSVWLGGHFAVGYVWVLPTGGWEFPALWIFAVLLFALTGGGPVSVDAWVRQAFPRIPSAIRPALA